MRWVVDGRDRSGDVGACGVPARPPGAVVTTVFSLRTVWAFGVIIIESLQALLVLVGRHTFRIYQDVGLNADVS